MAKFPVGSTVLFGYRFLFGRIGTVLRAAGVPAGIYAGADYAARAYAASHPPPVEGLPPTGDTILAALLALFVQLAAASAAAIAIARIVFAQTNTATPLSSAGSTIRLIFANARFVLGAGILFGLAAGIGGIALRLAGVASESGRDFEPSVPVFIATVLSVGLFAYAFVSMLRMGFFLVPAVAAERKAGLLRSHELTKGNIWRAICAAFLLGLPVGLLAILAAASVVRSAFGDEPITPGPETIRRVQEAIAGNLFVWEALSAAMFVFYAGLVHSGSAFAYAAMMRRNSPAP